MSEAWQRKPAKASRIKLKNRRVKLTICNGGKYVKLDWVRLIDNCPNATRVCLTREAFIATTALAIAAIHEMGAADELMSMAHK